MKNKVKVGQIFLVTAALTGAVLGTTSAGAQTATQVAAESPLLEEVVVTARKRAEALQDIHSPSLRIVPTTWQNASSKTCAMLLSSRPASISRI